MSVTVTDNPVARNTLNILADYKIHHSGEENHAAPPPNNPEPVPTQDRQFKSSQNTQTNGVQNGLEATSLSTGSWRDMPPVRPPHRNLDLSERPVGANPALITIIGVMFTGVYIKAVNTTSQYQPRWYH